MAETPPPVPLEAAPVSCWRCGGPSRRHGLLRYDPCATCQAMLAEVQARYQGARPAPEGTHGKGDAHA